MTASKRSPRKNWVSQNIQSKIKKGILLDIGFVGGDDIPELHLEIKQRNPQLQIFGLDIDKEGIMRRQIPDSLAGDATVLPFLDGTLDAILCLEVIEHIYQPERMFEEIYRTLKNQGTLIITTPSSWAWWNFTRHWLLGSTKTRKNYDVFRSYLGAPSHKRFFDPLSLLNILYDYGFETIELTTKNHSIPFLTRFSKRFGILDLQFWPMDRLGGYICLIARKKTH
ncbi:class I SAM-dependent methyltransferase [Thermodesulfobacteriota bacterium]